MGAQWLSGRVLDSRPKGRGFEPHRRHCVVSLSKNINPSLVLVQPRKTRPFITERLLMGRKESNQINQTLGSTVQWETRQALFPTGTVGPRVGIFLSPLNTNDGFYLSHTPVPALGKDKKRLAARRPHAGRTSFHDVIVMLN